MREDEDDTLFSGRGQLPEDLARLERSLSRLPVPPEPDWDAAPRGERRSPVPRRPERRWAPVLAWAAAAAVLLVSLAGVLFARDAWRVDTLAGSPTLRGVAFGGRVGLGGRVVTDEHSRARLEVKGLGRVELEPDGVLRRVPGRGAERKLALDHGTLHAFISAPPRQFVVATPAGVAIDLGCAYTLSVTAEGRGRLAVTAGRVAFTHGGLESFVPAGVWCPLLPAGEGVPRRDYASDTFLAAIAAYDSASAGDAAALAAVLEAAEASDAITLWHLLPRTSGEARSRVASRIAGMIEVPADVPLANVLALEPEALDAWWGAIGMGPAAEWRAGTPKKGFPW
jgi:ferric-dicitrate binding protein FerR (iron transport regulator)